MSVEVARAASPFPTLRTVVNIICGIAFSGFLVAGLFWIVPPPAPAGASSAQTVTDSTKTTTDSQKTVIEKTQTTVTNPPALWERYLAEGRLEVLVRVAIVVLIAFLGAAVLQRVAIGRYGITLPFLTIPDVADAAATSARGLEELQEAVSKQADDLKLALTQAASALEASAQSLRQLKELRRELRSTVDRKDVE